MRRSVMALALLAAGCTACGSGSGSSDTLPGATRSPDSSTADASAPPSPVVAPRLDLPAPTASQGALFARSSNLLGVDLLKHAAMRRRNEVLSPASIAAALAMASGGARGETAAEMARVLHREGDAEAFHEAASRVLASWSAPGEHELRVASRLFGERSFRFEAPFLALTRDRYGAELEPLDFRSAADASRVHINAWVAAATRNRIRDLLPPKSITDATRLVLANAVYFLGEWVEPFDYDRTRAADFHRLDGSTVAVPTMHRTAHLAYLEDADAQLVELPYRGERMSMVVVLPRLRDGLVALVDGLTSAQLDGWIGGLAAREVQLALPKVTIDPALPAELSADLTALGMPLAFDADQADFTGVGVPPDPEQRLYLSRVFHKAFVRIDELGTEAAAASAVTMAVGTAAPGAPIPFHVDHPFLVVLRDRLTGTVLFFGLVLDPSARS